MGALISLLASLATWIEEQTESPEDDPGSPVFDIRLQRPNRQMSGPFSAMLDDRSVNPVNWITRSCVVRSGWEDWIEAIYKNDYAGLWNHSSQPEGAVNIKWKLNNVTRESRFLIRAESPVDVVLNLNAPTGPGCVSGRELQGATSVIRPYPLTEDEIREMQGNSTRMEASNDELLKTRDAEDAAARERKRAKRMASKVSRSATLETRDAPA